MAGPVPLFGEVLRDGATCVGRGVPVWWQPGVMLTAGLAPLVSPAGPNSEQTLPVAAGNKVDPEIPELWEVGFNVISCNRRRGQIIGAKVSL